MGAQQEEEENRYSMQKGGRRQVNQPIPSDTRTQPYGFYVGKKEKARQGKARQRETAR
jgi:hypothetical protein